LNNLKLNFNYVRLLRAKNKIPDSKAAAGTVIIHAAIMVRK